MNHDEERQKLRHDAAQIALQNTRRAEEASAAGRLPAPLARTVCSVATYKGLQGATEKLIGLAEFGRVVVTRGISDTAIARIHQIKNALEKGEYEMVVLLDDDMTMQPEDVEQLVCLAWNRKAPMSAAYVVDAEPEPRLAADRMGPGRWLAGLGCLAVPATVLRHLWIDSDPIHGRGGELRAITWSGPASKEELVKMADYGHEAPEGLWLSEDYRLSLRLHGVEMTPIQAGHLKTRALWPNFDEESRQILIDELNDQAAE